MNHCGTFITVTATKNAQTPPILAKLNSKEAITAAVSFSNNNMSIYNKVAGKVATGKSDKIKP